MPLYDYKCPECGKELKDIKTSFSRDDSVVCSKCGVEMKREFPLPGRPKVKGGTRKFHT